MTMDYAARAQAHVGTRFRLQGRGEGGLDCIGLVLTTFGISGSDVRRDYRIAGNCIGEVRARLDEHFRRVRKAELKSGDVMLLAAGKQQLHLAVRTEQGFVHAHAGIRRVVETPGMPEWTLLGVYRKRRSR
jgi:cell wall-associated NlpC family hydrolase